MKKNIFIPAKTPEYKKIKVAAYCRVSTLNKIQRESLQWQVEYYTNLISENPDWILAGVFYDVGKSGLRIKGRTGLDKMLKKASRGKMDYILVKSISRLSRDTIDVLKIIRVLRERGKVVWRCATRMEKGRDACGDSPTLHEELVKKILGENVCEDRSYNEDVVRNRVEKIVILNEYLEIYYRNGMATLI